MLFSVLGAFFVVIVGESLTLTPDSILSSQPISGYGKETGDKLPLARKCIELGKSQDWLFCMPNWF